MGVLTVSRKYCNRWRDGQEIPRCWQHIRRRRFLTQVLAFALINGNEADSSVLTSTFVVAHRKVRSNVFADIAQALARTILNRATHRSSSLPDDLAKVTPMFEVGHVRTMLAILIGEPCDFTVVERVCNDGRNVIGPSTSSNVLTVSTAIHGPKTLMSKVERNKSNTD
jgi:hypothetical protein